MTRVLILRPEPGAGATADRARHVGLDPLVIPLFEIEAVAWEPPDPAQFDAMLLTSANAAREAGRHGLRLRGLPVHAVGDATAEAAREAGFDIASRGEAGVERLLASLEPDLRLLHLCGVDRHEPMGVRQKITTMKIYRSRARDGVDMKEAAGAVALVHSPRVGRRLCELITDKSSLVIAAISAAAAEAAGCGWRRVEHADAPNDEALLALAARLCKTSAPQ
jgi:uroporphyrinogen-III synthase